MTPPVPKSIQEQWHIRTLTYRLADALVIVSGWLFANQNLAASADPSHALVMTLTIVVFQFVGEITGMYRNWRGVSADKEVACSCLTWSVTAPVMFGIVTLFKISPPNNAILFGWLVATLFFMMLSRLGLRAIQGVLRARGYNTRGYAIVGINDLAIQLAKNIENSPEMGLNLIGFYDDRQKDRLPEIHPSIGARIGCVDTLVKQARAGEVNMIYITFPMRAEDRIRSVLDRLADSTASVYLVPDFFVFELLHSRWTDIGGLPAVSVFENPFYGVDGYVKRALDTVIAGLLLCVLALPMTLIAILVKVTSPGPIFFRQKRYGLDGREILVWKFRSMRVCENGTSVKQATRNDTRVTAVGRILRSTSLDELPQLFNVINGTMSLVGPRPHASAHNEQYRSQIHGYMLRHKVRPGITGLAQVNGYRGETDTLEKMERRVECDHRYIREWSLLMDIKILFRTIFVVFSKQNAY